jgi:hypothetical protein
LILKIGGSEQHDIQPDEINFLEADIGVRTSPSRALVFGGSLVVIDDQEFAGPLVGSSFNPSCSWIAVKIDVPPAGLGGAAPLAPGVVSSGAYPEISRCSASDNRSFYYVEIAPNCSRSESPSAFAARFGWNCQRLL